VARPKGRDLVRRHRAYELWNIGVKKSQIARELGVSKAAIGYWAKEDRWTEKQEAGLAGQGPLAAASFATENALARAIERLHLRLAARITELETMCGSTREDVRLRAILAWMKLAKDMPIVAAPTSDPNNLSLIEDLADSEEEES